MHLWVVKSSIVNVYYFFITVWIPGNKRLNLFWRTHPTPKQFVGIAGRNKNF